MRRDGNANRVGAPSNHSHALAFVRIGKSDCGRCGHRNLSLPFSRRLLKNFSKVVIPNSFIVRNLLFLRGSTYFVYGIKLELPPTHAFLTTSQTACLRRQPFQYLRSLPEPWPLTPLQIPRHRRLLRQYLLRNFPRFGPTTLRCEKRCIVDISLR